MRFIGNITAKMDAKGRVFLPAVFRKILETEGEQKLILREDLFQHCLVLYPDSVWNSQLDELKARLNQWNGQHQMILRQFVADAEPVELDSNGRILISKRKLEFANITSDARFLAVDDRIEIWDKDTFDQIIQNNNNIGLSIENILGNE